MPETIVYHLECFHGHRMPYTAGEKLVGHNAWGENAGTLWSRPCPWCKEHMTLMRGDKPETRYPGRP